MNLRGRPARLEEARRRRERRPDEGPSPPAFDHSAFVRAFNAFAAAGAGPVTWGPEWFARPAASQPPNR